MTAPLQSSRLTFSQGILESQEATKVPVGFLQSCVNWVPEPSGGLRARAGWSKGSVTGAPATRRNLGIGLFQRYTTPSLVQTSTPVQPVPYQSAVAQQPVFTWPTPTQSGNLLLVIIAFHKTSASGSMTLTPATGWATRADITGATQNQIGVLEYPAAPSQQGDVTPFTITCSSATPFCAMTAWLIEVSGISSSPYDTSGTSTASPLVLSATSTQASEFLIAVSNGVQATSGTAWDWASTSASWVENLQAGQVIGTTPSWITQEAAVYTGTRTATGAQTITVTPSVTIASTRSGLVLGYKGFYSASPVVSQSSVWLTALDNTATYDIYTVNRSTLPSATYSTIETGIGDSTGGAAVAFTMGLSRSWYTAPSFTAIRSYDGVVVGPVTGSPVGARCIAIHKDRLWAGGTPSLPARVYFSQIGDGATWTGRGTGYFDFGRDDGEPVEDITPFGGGLVVGKATSCFFLSGDNTDTFSVSQLAAGGAAPGRSILATPYGCVIAGVEMVFLFDGSTVTPIGRAIENSYGVLAGSFISLSYIDGSIYIADGDNAKTFVFDLNAGVWRIEQIHTNVAEAAAVLYNYGDTQLYGPVAAIVGAPLNYRTFPGPTRTKDFTGISEVFSAQTGDLALAGPRRPITPRQLYLQLRQRGGTDANTGLTVTPVFAGTSGDPVSIQPDVPGVRRMAVPGFPQAAGAGTGTVGAIFSQTSPSGDAAIFDIEDAYIDFIPEQARPVG